MRNSFLCDLTFDLFRYIYLLNKFWFHLIFDFHFASVISADKWSKLFTSRPLIEQHCRVEVLLHKDDPEINVVLISNYRVSCKKEAFKVTCQRLLTTWRFSAKVNVPLIFLFVLVGTSRGESRNQWAGTWLTTWCSPEISLAWDAFYFS